MCGSIYRLGVTRRCLHDGHFFCSVPSPRPETPVSEDKHVQEDEPQEGADRHLSSSDVLLAKERQIHNAQRKRRKARLEGRRAIGCNAEFDYSGWAQYNSWRRYIKIYKFEKAATLRRQRSCNSTQIGVGEIGELCEWQEKENCWNDCEFPSECHNNRFKEEHERRQIQSLYSFEAFADSSNTEVKPPCPISTSQSRPEESEKGDGEQRWDFQGKVMEIEAWEAELQKQKVTEFERQERELEEMERFAVAIQGVEPTSLFSSPFSITFSSPSSVPIEEIDMERCGVEDEAQMVGVGLGPHSELELDDPQEYGIEFASKKRKKSKSIQKIAQLAGLMLGVELVEKGYKEEKPRSPLKERYTFGEVKWDEVTPRSDGYIKDVDLERQIEEKERGGSMFSRRVGWGEVGEFGDEDEDGIL